MKMPLVLPVAALLVGCAGEEDAPSREQVRADQAESEAAGKADALDLCERFGFYGDEVCDAWCPEPDTDCTHEELYLTLSGLMVDFSDNLPLVDGQVCGSGNCSPVAADGSYAVEIRKHRLVEVTASKAGYVPALITFLAGDSLKYNNRLVTEATYGLLATLFFGLEEVDPGKGALVTNAYRWVDGTFPDPNDAGAAFEPLAGMTYQIDRIDGDPGEFKTLYFGVAGLPDPALTETSEAGLGVSGELAPGIYRVVATPPDGLDCRARFLPSIPGGEVDAFVRVVPGAIAGIWTQCI
jgi:hypothetical protein